MLIISVTQFHYSLLRRDFRRFFWKEGSACRCNVLIGNVYWVRLQEGFAFLLCNEHCALILGLITCNNIPRPNISSRTAPRFRIHLLSWQFHYWFGAAIQDWKW